MVPQTKRCIQFHSTRITQIADPKFSIIYLNTKEHDLIPRGDQIRSLFQVGRGIKRCSVRALLPSTSDQTDPNRHNIDQGVHTTSGHTKDNSTTKK